VPPPAIAANGEGEGEGDGHAPLNIADELKDSYLTYAMSVIISRALPDVRDGLKPSQRRILVAMNDLHLGPSAGRVKCAKICGDTSGNYHPHGEASVYPTLVRMAQEWNLRYVLIDKQGNFGSIAGLPPAAMRYCVAGDTLVRTLNGTRRIADLARVEPNSETDLFLEVFDRNGRPVVASKLFHSGDHPTYRLRTAEGFELVGTANHPVLCLERGAGAPTLAWRLLGEIAPGARVVLARWTSPEESNDLPERDRMLAVLTGAWLAEGFASERRAGFNNTDKAYFDEVLRCYDAIVGGTRYLNERTIKSGSLLREIDIHNLTAFAASPLGEIIGDRSAAKHVPGYIWEGSLALKRAFLQALFEGDGSSSLLPRSTISISYSTRSRRLAKDVQTMLLEFGVVSRLAYYDDGEIKVYIGNRRDARLFLRRVGFWGAKQAKLTAELSAIPATSRALSGDFTPFIAEYIRRSGGGPYGSRDWLQRHNIDRVERWERDGDFILAKIESEEVRTAVAPLVRSGYYYADVTAIEPAGIQPVYSIRVESDCHSFITNGFVSHNTEARLSPVSAEMLTDLDHETVDMIPNYDGRHLEPTVLPSKFPNLLVNGSDGIAVGMATDIPPHNLREVCDAAVLLIDNPQANVQDLMEIVPGPDFPTGGIICGRQGIADAYSTGRGRITLRARADINEEGSRPQIIIREVPFQQTRIRLAESIGELVKDDRIKGIADIKDESSQRTGEPVRIVVYLKRDADPQFVLNQLYALSPLQKTVSVILLALVHGRPRYLSIKEMIEEFLRHRVQVIRRRTEYLMREAKRRGHVLEGKLIAISSLDEVIRVCREAPNRDEAKRSLQGMAVSAAVLNRALGEAHFAALQREIGAQTEYHMTEAQAEAVVRMQLGQLARLQRDEILKEYNDLREKIVGYERLLGSEANILAIVRGELLEMRQKYGDDRRTEITGEVGRVNMEDLIEEEDNAVTISHNGYIKRLPLNTYRAQHRGGRGVSGGASREDDFIEHFFVASTHAYLLCFTNSGRLYWLKVYDIPQGSRIASGRSIANVLSLAAEEKITSVVPVRRFEGDHCLIMATRRGVIKKTPLADYSRPRAGGIIGINLDDGDVLIDVALTQPGDEMLLCTRRGMAIRFGEADARAMGRNTRGVKGIALQGDDAVVGMVVADEAGYLLTVCENGYGKRTPFGLNTQGVEATEADDEETDGEPGRVSARSADEADAEAGEEAPPTASTMRYRKQRRGGKGVRDIRTTERNGPVVGVSAVRETDDIMFITTGGMVNRTHVREIRSTGRNTQGVRVMGLREGDKIASIAKVAQEEAEGEETNGAPEPAPTPPAG
jgi:DNA gyrase subunit A